MCRLEVKTKTFISNKQRARNLISMMTCYSLILLPPFVSFENCCDIIIWGGGDRKLVQMYYSGINLIVKKFSHTRLFAAMSICDVTYRN